MSKEDLAAGFMAALLANPKLVMLDMADLAKMAHEAADAFDREMTGRMVCPSCGDTFNPTHGSQKYCSQSCNQRAYHSRKKTVKGQ